MLALIFNKTWLIVVSSSGFDPFKQTVINVTQWGNHSLTEMKSYWLLTSAKLTKFNKMTFIQCQTHEERADYSVEIIRVIQADSEEFRGSVWSSNSDSGPTVNI